MADIWKRCWTLFLSKEPRLVVNFRGTPCTYSWHIVISRGGRWRVCMCSNPPPSHVTRDVRVYNIHILNVAYLRLSGK